MTADPVCERWPSAEELSPAVVVEITRQRDAATATAIRAYLRAAERFPTRVVDTTL